MKHLFLIGALAILAACGADGYPIRPNLDGGARVGR